MQNHDIFPSSPDFFYSQAFIDMSQRPLPLFVSHLSSYIEPIDLLGFKHLKLKSSICYSFWCRILAMYRMSIVLILVDNTDKSTFFLRFFQLGTRERSSYAHLLCHANPPNNDWLNNDWLKRQGQLFIYHMHLALWCTVTHWLVKQCKLLYRSRTQ